MPKRRSGIEGSITISVSNPNNRIVARGTPQDPLVQPFDMDEPFIVVHNHPSSDTFSFIDTRWMSKYDNCIGIVAIGNSGEYAYTLIKEESFNKWAILEYIQKVASGEVI